MALVQNMVYTSKCVCVCLCSGVCVGGGVCVRVRGCVSDVEETKLAGTYIYPARPQMSARVCVWCLM